MAKGKEDSYSSSDDFAEEGNSLECEEESKGTGVSGGSFAATVSGANPLEEYKLPRYPFKKSHSCSDLDFFR